MLVALLAAFAFACDSKEDGDSEAPEPEPVVEPEGKYEGWCAGHDLPEAFCTKCSPELEEKYKEAGDWCDEHGFPESACPKCNPMDPPDESGDDHDHEGGGDEHAGEDGEAASAEGEWCEGHGLPESHCTKCHPELEEKFKKEGDWCEEHGFPESACPKCNPMDPPEESGDSSGDSSSDDEGAEGLAVESIPGVEPGTEIRFKRDEHEEEAGIETVEAEEAEFELGGRAPAEIEFNRNAVADIRAPVPGTVRRVLVDLGEEVDESTPLFELESGQVGELQSEIRSAEQEVETTRSNMERQEKLAEKGLSATRRAEEARRDFERAKSRLSSLENSLQLAGSARAGRGGRYVLRSPIEGRVVERPAVVGNRATEETSLATVADTSTMWAMIDVSEREAMAVRKGQAVTLEVDGTDRDFEGKVTWVASEIDPKTRTLKVRAEVENPDGVLRANQFAHAEIGLAPGEVGVAVPEEAVQRIDGQPVVFVRADRGVYEPKAVRMGRSSEDRVQIDGDVEPGDRVVTTGAFLLKTELGRDGIGAGCCEVEGE